MKDEELLKVSDVAKSKEVTPNAVKGWIKNGLLPNAFLKETVAGSVWLIPANDLKDFVKPEKGRPKKHTEK